MQAKQSRDVAGDVQTGNDWPAIAIQIAVATIFSGVIAYVATNPEQLVQAQAAVSAATSHEYTPTTAMPAPSAVPDEPAQVQVTTPIDKSEVFQFPEGTSETEEHLAVAKLLTQRARERQQLWAHSDHRLKRRANQLQPVTSTDLTSTDVGVTPAVASTGVPRS